MFKTVIELLDDSVLTDLLDTRNKQNYLPLSLAAYCGRNDIFNLILSYQSKVLWVYGALHAVEYLLTDLDTVCHNFSKLFRFFLETKVLLTKCGPKRFLLTKRCLYFISVVPAYFVEIIIITLSAMFTYS